MHENTSEKGRAGETRAVDYLLARGYKILKRNYRSFAGEVDIVAVRDHVVVFVEVKTWNTLPVSEIGYVLGKEKKNRIFSSSLLFLRDNPAYEGFHIRYDVFFISGSTGNVQHLENAFYRD